MVIPLTIDQISKNLIADRFWRERRHPQWTTSYELYRDTVIINQLTQRQSVNVPYMKKTWKTYAAQTNWPVDNFYEDKGNDKQKEIFLNAYWDKCAERLKLDILEEGDRKQEWLYGPELHEAQYVGIEVRAPLGKQSDNQKEFQRQLEAGPAGSTSLPIRSMT